MDITLTPHQARVIGSLVEKQITTPDQYPLSLNALVSACNQRSNRDPVMTLDEATVQSTLDELAARHLVSEKSGFGSRVSRYQQRFCNTEFGSLQLSEQERAVVCELLLRGPQTPGELRTRASRLCPFADVREVEAVLDRLGSREDGPFIVRLPREPGRRESRYTHLFGGEAGGREPGAEEASGAPVAGDAEKQRIHELERAVAELREEMEDLCRRLEEISSAGRAGGNDTA